jgi:ketosteroid isomerase-like protein
MDNKNIVTLFLKLWSEGRLENAYALLADDMTWEIPGDLPFSGLHDKKTMYSHNQNLQGFYASWPQWIVDGLIAEGDKVAVEAHSVADMPSGLKYRNHYHLLFILRKGKITWLKEYMDTKHVADFKNALKFSSDADRAAKKDLAEKQL